MSKPIKHSKGTIRSKTPKKRQPQKKENLEAIVQPEAVKSAAGSSSSIHSTATAQNVAKERKEREIQILPETLTFNIEAREVGIQPKDAPTTSVRIKPSAQATLLQRSQLDRKTSKNFRMQSQDSSIIYVAPKSSKQARASNSARHSKASISNSPVPILKSIKDADTNSITSTNSKRASSVSINTLTSDTPQLHTKDAESRSLRSISPTNSKRASPGSNTLSARSSRASIKTIAGKLSPTKIDKPSSLVSILNKGKRSRYAEKAHYINPKSDLYILRQIVSNLDKPIDIRKTKKKNPESETIDSVKKMQTATMPETDSESTSSETELLSEPVLPDVGTSEVLSEDVAQTQYLNLLHTLPETDSKDNLTERFHFMNFFRDLPRLSQISDTMSEDVLPAEAALDVPTDTIEGGFVGTKDASSVSSKATTSEAESIEEESSSLSSFSSMFVSLDSTSVDIPYSMEHFRASVMQMECNTDEVIQHLTLIEPLPSESSVESADKANVRSSELVYESCELFLNQIIDKIVATCETYERRLSKKLDKLKLWRQLRLLASDLCFERTKCSKLRQLATEYFLRKKRYSFVSVKNKTKDTINQARFVRAMQVLDHLLNQLHEVEQIQLKETSQLREQAEEAHNLFEHRVFNFETLVRETLMRREDFTHLNNHVDDLLRRMSRFRHEIGDIRLQLLSRQHQYAFILDQIEQLEDLGDGLTLSEYQTISSEVQDLAIKISERSVDLKRLHNRITFDIHALAHVRNKEFMLRQNLHKHRRTLRHHLYMKQHYRERIYRSTLVHNKFLKDMQALKSTGGLIYFPKLLQDFYAADDFINEKRDSISNLREERLRLINRIRQIEKKKLEILSRSSRKTIKL